MRKFYFVLILILYSFALYPGSSFAAKDLELTISFDKEEYTTKEPIYVTPNIKNNTKEPIWINWRFYMNSDTSPNEHREVYFLVTSPKGDRLKCEIDGYETGLPRTDYFILLEPGKDVSIERKKSIKHFFDFSEPGEYKIEAVYQNVHGKELGLDAFKGELKSKPVTIKISE